MYNRNTQQPTNKEQALYIAYLQKEVLNAFNIDYNSFIKITEETRYLKALSRVTATNRGICTAFNIHVPNGTRYKRTFEKQGFLKQSKEKIRCRYSGGKAYNLTTDPKIIKRYR